MTIEQVVNAVEIAIHKLPHMETLYRQIKDKAEKMQRTIPRLENDIENRKNKISILDKTAFSCEQDCKRTEQKVQELTAKKDRIEKLIATILSDDNEDYTKLKAIVKESVKDVLSDNKTLISIAFAALLQTLKTDPQMVKLIQNTPHANDSEQRKDNDININKYLEFNKDNLLDLAEKYYQNLVDILTNNVINKAAASPSNCILSLPQSSSPTFPNLSNQCDTSKIEESKDYHNSKDDIAD
jgi:predicted ribosome quality control (RQC) complex YloA/Tae2 family protein